jgi:hypothetical protein
MVCSAARYSTVLKPTKRQNTMKVIAGLRPAGVPSQSIGAMPVERPEAAR